MPIFGINYIELKLVEVLRLDADRRKWKGLCTLLNWDPRDSARVAELNRIKTEFIPTASKPPRIRSPSLASSV